MIGGRPGPTYSSVDFIAPADVRESARAPEKLRLLWATTPRLSGRRVGSAQSLAWAPHFSSLESTPVSLNWE